MPNWCAGDLKIRGKKEDVLRFLRNEVVLVTETEHLNLNWEYSEEEEICSYEAEEDSDVWFKESKEMFYEGSTQYLDCYEREDGNLLIILGNVKSAWSLDKKWLIRKSEEYHVDFKIFIFHPGNQYNLDFEVHSGEVVKNEKIRFEDYGWDCVKPTVGG